MERIPEEVRRFKRMTGQELKGLSKLLQEVSVQLRVQNRSINGIMDTVELHRVHVSEYMPMDSIKGMRRVFEVSMTLPFIYFLHYVAHKKNTTGTTFGNLEEHE